MSKPFIITTSQIDNYGGRVLPEGAVWDRYLKNPVLLYMHERGKVIGRVENIQLVDGKWEGTPVFDLADEEASDIARKYDQGFLNGVSAWFDVIEVSEDPKYMLPGQTIPTFTKWEVMEISIVDIPANAETVAKRMYTRKSAGMHTPEEFKFPTIKKNEAMSDMLSVKKAMGLDEKAGEAEMLLAYQRRGARVAELETLVSTLEEKIGAITKDSTKKAAEALVDGAVAAQKITAAEKESYLNLAQLEGGYDQVKSILDKKQPYKSITSQIAGGGSTNQTWEAKKAARADWSHTKWAQEDTAGLKYARDNDKEFYQSLIDNLKK